MAAFLDLDMKTIAGLTKAGRLSDATALIQDGLRRSLAKKTTSGSRTSDGVAAPPAQRAEILPRLTFGAALPGSTRGANERDAPRERRRMPRDLPGETPIPTTRRGGRATPSPSPAGASFETRSLANAAGRRDYKLYSPSSYRGQRLPLVVMLHGCTQSPDDFARGTRMNALAEELGFFVAYPEQPKAANGSKCWNWFNAGDQIRDRGEPSLVADITREIMGHVAVDPQRVFVAGLSAGGAAAVVLASVYPELYAGVGVHSGLACGAARDVASAFAAMRNGAPSAAHARRPQRAIIFHGSADRTVNPINADQVVGQFASGQGRSVSEGRSSQGMGYTRAVEADASGRPMLEQWTLHGAGHAWSGGDPAGSYTDPRGPDASREMLRFFLQG